MRRKESSDRRGRVREGGMLRSERTALAGVPGLRPRVSENAGG